MRRAAVLAVGRHHPLDRLLERGDCRCKLRAHRRELRPALLREIGVERTDLGDHTHSDLAAVTGCLATDEIVGLDARCALVDGDDASVAIMLCGTRLLDVPHTAV